MIQQKDVAQSVSSTMLEVSEKINETIWLVKSKCTIQEFEAYREASAKVMASILLEILNPIYAVYPEIKPKELK